MGTKDTFIFYASFVVVFIVIMIVFFMYPYNDGCDYSSDCPSMYYCSSRSECVCRTDSCNNYYWRDYYYDGYDNSYWASSIFFFFFICILFCFVPFCFLTPYPETYQHQRVDATPAAPEISKGVTTDVSV